MTLREHIEQTVWPRRNIAGQLGYVLLRPLSSLFGVGVSVRDLAYRSGLLRMHRAPCAVVSVGNLAVGGTGKTPFTSWNACRAIPSCLRLFWHWARAAASRTFWTAGSSKPMRVAMMAMTTRSSISVKARKRDEASM